MKAQKDNPLHLPNTQSNHGENIRRTHVKRLLVSLAVCLATALGMAQPNYMNYQGKLVQESGDPLPGGQYTMEVNIYDAPQDGNLIWGPFYFDGGTGAGHTASVSVMDGGTFNVIMGDTDINSNPLKSAFDHTNAAKRYIQLAVNGGDPMLPRQQFLTAPYAFQAGRLQHLVDTSAGNIGIGTETPTAKLDVNGDIKAAGALNVGGDGRVAGVLTVGSSVNDTNTNLKVIGGLNVSTDIEFGGKIVNFATYASQQVTRYVPGGNNITWSYSNLEKNSAEWYCALSYMGGYLTNTSGNQGQYGCEVYVSGNSWWLRAGVDGNGATDCKATCFKFN